MLIYVPAMARGSANPVWILDPKIADPVPGSIADTWRRVLQITSDPCQCVIILTFDEINAVAGSQILPHGIDKFPHDSVFDPMRKQMLAWQAEKKGAFGFSIRMSHVHAAEFVPQPPFKHVICGGLLICSFASTRDHF